MRFHIDNPFFSAIIKSSSIKQFLKTSKKKATTHCQFARYPAFAQGEKKMDSDWKPDENDVIEVLEAHHLLPTGPLLEEALELVSLYEDRLRKRLEELPSSVNRKKALMAFLEEGFMQEGIIPNSHKKIYDLPDMMR